MQVKLKKPTCAKIDETTWRFEESFFGVPVYMYLLLGEDKALLIDTGYGFTNVPQAIRELTSLPLLVINTHGHFDHMHGNHLYPEVMLHPADTEVFVRHNDYEQNLQLLREMLKGTVLPGWIFPLLKPIANPAARSYPSRRIALPEQMYFELGNRKVTILETPGHTIGSICLLDEKNRWLFCGDMGCEDGALLNFPESADLKVFYQSMLQLNRLAEEGTVTALFPGHQKTPLSTDILQVYLEACELLLSGSLDPNHMNQGDFTHKSIRINLGERKIR